MRGLTAMVRRYPTVALLVILSCFGPGCESEKLQKQRGQQEGPTRKRAFTGENTGEADEEPLGPEPEGTGFDFSFSNDDSAGLDSGHENPGLEMAAANDMLVQLVAQATAYGPTLVVWILDNSPSAQTLIKEVSNHIGSRYADLADDSNSNDESRLLTAACICGSEVLHVLDPPAADPAQLATVLQNLETDTTGREMLFSGVQISLQKYLAYRTEDRREVIFIMLSDEAGDDAELAEQIAPTMRRYGIPLYVLGVPAPFGRLSADEQQLEAQPSYRATDEWLPIRQGPESLLLERLQLAFWDQRGPWDRMDSGFGPFGLEYLCRHSGGRFLALRPRRRDSTFAAAGRWPATASHSFAPDAMRRYAPEYVSSERYQSQLAQNAALQSLHEASQIPGLRSFGNPQFRFAKRSEADLVRQLNVAQQVAARVEPAVNLLYETLEKGEAEREELQQPRWLAGYDLAFGRAGAMKARIDGYNAMLAALKRGRKFQRPDSSTWVLEPADSTEVSSALRRLVEQSRSCLQRVIEEHPGTPWAAIARRELQVPAGWKWSEE